MVLDRWWPSLTDCGRSVRKSLTHRQMGKERPKWESFWTRISGMMWLNAELKSRKSILT